MRTDPSKSAYHADPASRGDFDREEWRRARFLLRRLRFLETKAAEGPEPDIHIDLEIESLEWVLSEIGFLAPKGVPA